MRFGLAYLPLYYPKRLCKACATATHAVRYALYCDASLLEAGQTAVVLGGVC